MANSDLQSKIQMYLVDEHDMAYDEADEIAADIIEIIKAEQD